MLQECQKSELDHLLSENEGVLEAKYDVEFCSFPSTFWTNWLTEASDYEPREHGVCVLIKKSTICKTRTEHVPIDLPNWELELPEHSLGARACFVHATVPSWNNSEVLIVTSHLDADSVRRAGMQGVELAKKIRHVVDTTEGLEMVIWGGDFNMEMRCSAMQSIQAEGFKVASKALQSPTVFAVACTVRVDHIMYYQKAQSCNMPLSTKSSSIQPIATLVPKCPLGHQISVMPFLTEMQWLRACAMRHECGFFAGLLCFATALFLLPLVLLLFTPIFVYFWDRKRQCERLMWALAEWGSDHLPVTVCLEREDPVVVCRSYKRLSCAKKRLVRCLRSSRRASTVSSIFSNRRSWLKAHALSSAGRFVPYGLGIGASICKSFVGKCKHKKRWLWQKAVSCKRKLSKRKLSWSLQKKFLIAMLLQQAHA
jgi:endonuclease/exonuclease/phosphatase family metal-dependent hydrolase